jgi:predicted NBD/HSP70 family sugar kinase
LEQVFHFFVGIDWGSEKHRICLMDSDGKVVGERWTQHSSAGLAELIAWLRESLGSPPATVAMAIEVPRGLAAKQAILALTALNPGGLEAEPPFPPKGVVSAVSLKFDATA